MGATKIMIVVAGWLLASPHTVALAVENPYLAIVARNVFGLKEPPLPPNPEDNKPPPPKISLGGIATVLNKKQVLFQVETPPKPPQTGGKTAMILAVGETQDEIEVLEIVEATGTVKFRNHGVEQTKTMEKDSDRPVGTALPSPVLISGPGNFTLNVPRPSVPQPGLQSIPIRQKNVPAGDSVIPSGAP